MAKEPIRGSDSTDFSSARSLGRAYVDGSHASEQAKKVVAYYHAEIIRRHRERLAKGS